jgi:hypothetical protein
MKKIVLSFAAVSACSMAVMLFFNEGNTYSNSSGAPAQNCVACHGGTVQTDPALEFEIIDTATIQPTSTYLPNKTYAVIISYEKAGINKFGFSVTTNIGTFSKTDPSDNTLQFQNAGRYATHTFAGTAASAPNTAEWAMFWTAPASVSGNATFQMYLNAANGDNSDGGDLIYGANKSLTGTTGLKHLSQETRFHVFPNPATNQLRLILDTKFASDLSVSVTSIDGRTTRQLGNQLLQKGYNELPLDIADLPKGLYLLTVQTNEGRQVQKICIN